MHACMVMNNWQFLRISRYRVAIGAMMNGTCMVVECVGAGIRGGVRGDHMVSRTTENAFFSDKMLVTCLYDVYARAMSRLFYCILDKLQTHTCSCS